MYLQLRNIKPTDLECLYQFQADPIANQMADFPARDRSAFFEHWQTNILSNADIAAKAIIVDGDIVGSIVLWQSDHQWLLGYWLGREYWGKGFASNALRVFLSEHTQRPIIAEVTENNCGSIKVLEKNSFKHIGVADDPDSALPLLEFRLN